MRPQQMNRSEKKPEKLTKSEKVYNAVQKMKQIAALRKKETTA